MNKILLIILGIVSILLIYIILIQSSKNSNIQGDSINTSEQQFFSKSRGVEHFLKKITMLLIFIFFILVIILAAIIK